MSPLDKISKLTLSLPDQAPRKSTAEKQTFHEEILGALAKRQQLLASNIANADTPNYKAVDVDVNTVLREIKAGSEPLALTATAPGHLSSPLPTVTMPVVKYRIPQQPSIDGNTVDMQVEQAQFAENALRYQFTLDRVGGRYKMMRELLSNLS